MQKLMENQVWCYSDEDHKYLDDAHKIVCHNYICNYGSKPNFLRIMSTIRSIRGNWVKDRISESSNVIHQELSKQYPNSFIYYITNKPYGFSLEDVVVIKVISKV